MIDSSVSHAALSTCVLTMWYPRINWIIHQHFPNELATCGLFLKLEHKIICQKRKKKELGLEVQKNTGSATYPLVN